MTALSMWYYLTLPYIAHKVASTIADAAKKRKRVDINVKSSQEPQSKKAFVDA